MKRLLIILVFLPFLSWGQYFFQYKADLQRVDSTGFYNIFLPPVVTSKLNYKFSDIRIYDSRGKEIPYIRDTEKNRFKTARRAKLRIIQNEHKTAKKYTVVMIHNPDQKTFSNFAFIIRNTDAQIWVNISASNDLKNWQILKNNVRYQKEFSDSATAQLLINDLPESNYQYYRVIFFDYNREPIIILNAYTYFVEKRRRDYVEVPHPMFFQDDTSEPQKTIVKIVFKHPQYIDKIAFKIQSPEYYLRSAELTTRDTSTGKKIRLQYYFNNQKNFYLCSDSSNVLLLSRYYAKELYLVVDNNNNEPLVFKDIRAYQVKEHLIAKLERGLHYTVKFGNQNIPAPIYDLRYFINKIPRKRPEITVVNIVKLSNPKTENKRLYIKPIYLWTALGVVLVIMIIISVIIFTKYKSDELT